VLGWDEVQVLLIVSWREGLAGGVMSSSTARLHAYVLPEDRVDSLVADLFFVVEGADVG
jgi:hypothetical protein